MKLSELFKKIKSKGLVKSSSIFISAYIFSHWKMYLLERPLELQSIAIDNSYNPVPVTHENLYIFEKYFKSYIPSIKKLLNDNTHAEVYTDENGDAYAMVWIHEGGDYYDNLLYKCRIPVPKDSIYQFAGEVAKHKRGGRFTTYFVQRFWNEYHKKGFKTARALVNSNNTLALRTHLKLHFAETGTLIHIYRLFTIFTYAKYENYSETRLEIINNKLKTKK